MLSNYLIGSHPIVLFIDDVGIERSALKLIDKLCKEQNVEASTISMLPPISKLELDLSENEIIEKVQLLKLNPNVSQIFLWACSRNISSQLIVPFLSHMSSVIVHITSNKHITILTKRKFSSIQVKHFQHELGSLQTSIKEVKLKTTPKEVAETPSIEKIGTFKIAEFNKEELEMKKKLKLPFEIIDLPNTSQKKEGNIIYSHDSADDFDEEDDPDNDLIF